MSRLRSSFHGLLKAVMTRIEVQNCEVPNRINRDEPQDKVQVEIEAAEAVGYEDVKSTLQGPAQSSLQLNRMKG